MGGLARKPVIGILGGIGSGKTTVAMEFGRLGCAVIHADRIAHDVLRRPDVRQRILDLLGPSILDPDGTIDRKAVAALVFADPVKVSALNQIVHPPVLREVERLMGYYQERTRVPAIVLDMPLLLEVGWTDRCDRLVFVACDPRTRASRAGSLTAEEILSRENCQISLDTKATAADNTINNNSDFSALIRQIATIFSSVMKN